MVARYTVSLEQVSPDTSAGVAAIYDELPKGFSFKPGTVVSSDIPDIDAVDPNPLGSPQDQILKWAFSTPITFQQGEVKKFSFDVDINKSAGRYCNRAFLKMTSGPNEKTTSTAHVIVGTNPPDGCGGAGVEVTKFVDKTSLPPSVQTIITYVINVENLGNSTQQVESLKDVLPTGGFQYCRPTDPPGGELSCDYSRYKVVDDPFDPGTDSFTETSTYTTTTDPTETYDGSADRWELFWDGPGAGWSLAAAGKPDDTLVFRFQVTVTITASGTYYNEVFANTDCAAPSELTTPPDDVTSRLEYCASYSWPTGGSVVPRYDVRSTGNRSLGQGNVDFDVNGDASLKSWHVQGK